MSPEPSFLFSFEDLENKLGYAFSDRRHLLLAFTHKSYVNEDKGAGNHNERLEFLGDSVLGLLISEFLYHRFPDTKEGDLSYLRSRLVEASSCASYLSDLELEKDLLLGKGEKLNEGRGRSTIMADLFEAVIGAIYLDGGLEAAKRFLFSCCSEKIEDILKTPLKNWKALLQDYAQKTYGHPPTYVTLNESGPDHVKMFEVAALLKEKELGRGSGSSKKQAQQEAAKKACIVLGID